MGRGVILGLSCVRGLDVAELCGAIFLLEPVDRTQLATQT